MRWIVSTEEQDKDNNKVTEEIAVAAAAATPKAQPALKKDALPELTSDDDNKDQKKTEKIRDEREFVSNSSSIAEALKAALLNLLSPKHGMAFGEGFAYKLLVKPLVDKVINKVVSLIKGEAKTPSSTSPLDKVAGNEDLAKRAQENVPAQSNTTNKSALTIRPTPQARKIMALTKDFKAQQLTPAAQKTSVIQKAINFFTPGANQQSRKRAEIEQKTKAKLREEARMRIQAMSASTKNKLR